MTAALSVIYYALASAAYASTPPLLFALLQMLSESLAPSPLCPRAPHMSRICRTALPSRCSSHTSV